MTEQYYSPVRGGRKRRPRPGYSSRNRRPEPVYFADPTGHEYRLVSSPKVVIRADAVLPDGRIRSGEAVLRRETFFWGIEHSPDCEKCREL